MMQEKQSLRTSAQCQASSNCTPVNHPWCLSLLDVAHNSGVTEENRKWTERKQDPE